MGARANGVIIVSATDKEPLKCYDIRIEVSSGLTVEEIERMKKDAEANVGAEKLQEKEQKNWMKQTVWFCRLKAS